GAAVGAARGELLPVPDDPRGGADEQPGGAGDPVRGARPGGDAGDAERGGGSVVRADLDGGGDVRPARAFGVRVPAVGSRGVVRRGRRAVAPARGLGGGGGPRGGWPAQVQGPMGPGNPGSRTPVMRSVT